MVKKYLLFRKDGEPKTYSANKVDFGKNEGFRRQEVRK